MLHYLLRWAMRAAMATDLLATSLPASAVGCPQPPGLFGIFKHEVGKDGQTLATVGGGKGFHAPDPCLIKLNFHSVAPQFLNESHLLEITDIDERRGLDADVDGVGSENRDSRGSVCAIQLGFEMKLYEAVLDIFLLSRATSRTCQKRKEA